MELILSNSEIQKYKSCRRAWYVEYILGYGTEKQTGPLALGNRVHATLAHYYEHGISADDSLRFYNLSVAGDTDAIDVLKYDDFVEECKLGFIMLDGYFQWIKEEGADSDIEIVEPEKEIEYSFDFGEHRVTLLAKLDAIGWDHQLGRTFFLDHKTGDGHALDLNEQVLMYAFLQNRIDPDKPISYAIWNVLRKVKRTARAKPPFYYRLEHEVSPLMLDNFGLRLQGEIGDIIQTKEKLAAGVDHRLACYPRPSRDCDWACDVRNLCPMWEDGSHIDAALAAIMKSKKPYARYLSVQNRDNNAA